MLDQVLIALESPLAGVALYHSTSSSHALNTSISWQNWDWNNSHINTNDVSQAFNTSNDSVQKFQNETSSVGVRTQIRTGFIRNIFGCAPSAHSTLNSPSVSGNTQEKARVGLHQDPILRLAVTPKLLSPSTSHILMTKIPQRGADLQKRLCSALRNPGQQTATMQVIVGDDVRSPYLS